MKNLILDGLGLEYRDGGLEGKLLYRGRQYFSASALGPVRLGNHADNIFALLDKGLEGGHSKFWGAHKNNTVYGNHITSTLPLVRAAVF